MRRKFLPIPKDGFYNGPLVNGKILKLVFINEKELPEVDVTIFLDTQEQILNLKGLRKGTEVFIPTNKIDESFIDYHYSTGSLNINVDGLKEGETIGQVWVIFVDK